MAPSSIVVVFCIFYLCKGTYGAENRGFEIAGLTRIEREKSLRTMAEQGRTQALKRFMKENEVNVDAVDQSTGWTALHYASDAGHDEVVSLLLKATKLIDPKDKKGLTPLHLATKKSFVKVVELLVSAGAKIGSPDQAYHWTPLHWAVYQKAVDVTAALLKAKTDINFQDYLYGQTPLHYASAAGHEEVVSLLLKATKEYDPKDNKGQTPLHLATKKSFVRVVERLVSAGANIGSQDYAYHWTPLHWAVFQKAVDVTAALLKAKTDINFQDFSGETALHLAAKGGNIDILKCILSAKPNMNIRDVNGKNALDVAANEQVKLDILIHELRVEMTLAADEQLKKVESENLQKYNLALQQAAENLLTVQQSEQGCMTKLRQCLSIEQQLKQNVTLLKKEIEDAIIGPGTLSTMCIGAVFLIVMFYCHCCEAFMNKISETFGNVTHTAHVTEIQAEERANKAEEKDSKAEREVELIKSRAVEAEARAIKAEEKASAAEHEAKMAIKRAAAAEAIAKENARKAEERASAAEGEANMALDRAAAAEERAEASWIVQREEIELTANVLGTGDRCVVRAAKFRGIDVAAKHLHHTVLFPYSLQLFKREMNLAVMARHPNLALFIGATVDKECIILTELMPYSLKEILENGKMSKEHVLSVAMDVCKALNYLHLTQPVPIVHRYVSSANVLLQPLNPGKWRAKLSDYVSTNFINQLFTAPARSNAYAAPESDHPSQQTPKLDTFSYGMLLLEMTSGQYPDLQKREALLQSLTPSPWVTLIAECTTNDPGVRPDMTCILDRLNNVAYCSSL